MEKQKINIEYIKDFQSGLSIWDIAKKYNNTYKNVSESITGHRFEAKLLPFNEKEKIRNLYLEGNSTVQIGKLYGVNNKCIASVLNEYNICRNQAIFVRKYNVNETYFDSIDTPNKAYIIGLLSADGCNYPEKGTIYISLEECDVDLLNRIREEMKNEHPLEFIDYTNKHDFGYTYKNQYRMLIFSSHMCKVLEDIGIIPNKSLLLKFSEAIPIEFYSHYIRGVFDGDGSLGVKDINTYKGTISISITSTFDFCNHLQKILNEMDINSIVSEASNKNGITAVLNINKNESKFKFLNWIYEDADLLLQRKYEIYLRHYNFDNINNSLIA